MNTANLLAPFMVLLLMSASVQSQPTPQQLAEGKRLYAINCANCHGNEAQGAIKAGFDISIITERGGKQPPDLTDGTWDHGSSDTAIFSVIKKGLPAQMMPPFEGQLSDGAIRNVIAFIRSLGLSRSTVAKVKETAPRAEIQKLILADYLEMPITGDMTADRVSGVLARGSIMQEEPGGGRFFLNDLTGPLYILDKKTKKLTQYLNFDGANGHAGLFPKFTAAMGYAAGMMNFAFDPDYVRNGIFYTLHMENISAPGENAIPKADVVAGLNIAGYTTTSPLPNPGPTANPELARDLVVVEWKDSQIRNLTFEGTAREVLRIQVPGRFHPLNEIIFNPTARPGDPDWRVMYLGIGDAGTGERPGPMRLYAQRLDTYQGKVLRIIPTLSEHQAISSISGNGRYRIPNDNPFVSIEGARKEIWAYGIRNPHRLTWYVDPVKPREPILFAFDIGLVSWETVLIIKKGANYGYPLREGTQTMSPNGMGLIPANDTITVYLSDTVTRGTVTPTYPVIAYPHNASGGDAIANGFVYRGKKIPALKGTFVFGDVTTGHIWYAKIKDVLAADDGNPLTIAALQELTTDLRELSVATYKKRGGTFPGLPGRSAVAGSGRIDLRLAEDSAGELYTITKGDGMIRSFESIKYGHW